LSISLAIWCKYLTTRVLTAINAIISINWEQESGPGKGTSAILRGSGKWFRNENFSIYDQSGDYPDSPVIKQSGGEF
jgi:hypothetical protein